METTTWQTSAKIAPISKVKIALPKGRLMQPLMKKLSEIGLQFSLPNDRCYKPISADSRFSALLVKARSVPEWLASGYFDMGFCGLDAILDSNSNVRSVLDLGLNPVKIVAATTMSNFDILDQPQTRQLVIATEYPQLAQHWADEKNIDVKIIKCFGATEALVPEIADLVIDCVETQSTLFSNGLVTIDTLMSSSTHLVASQEALQCERKSSMIQDIVQALKEGKAKYDQLEVSYSRAV